MPPPADPFDARAADPVTQRLIDAVTTAPAIRWLDDVEARTGVPLVDESERGRLDRLQRGEPRDPRWWSLAAHLDGEVVGYGAVVLPDAPQDQATGDVAVDVTIAGATPPDPVSVRSVLLQELRHLVVPERAASLQVWMRYVGDRHLLDIEQDGFVVARRLGILGRRLDDEVELPDADGVTIRAYVPDQDDAAVVDVLARAYEGTGDGGWTTVRFAERRALPWFRPEDLLLATDDTSGDVLGLHWLKRRGEGVGEVYNLAIGPEGQGRGVGAVLLSAGLAHLREVGCHDVLLWVDRANERAVQLYTSRGFTTRWDDVALETVPSRG